MNRISLRGATGFSLVVLLLTAIASPVFANSRGEFPDGFGDTPRGGRQTYAVEQAKGYVPPDEGAGSSEPTRAEGSGTRREQQFTNCAGSREACPLGRHN